MEKELGETGMGGGRDGTKPTMCLQCVTKVPDGRRGHATLHNMPVEMVKCWRLLKKS